MSMIFSSNPTLLRKLIFVRFASRSAYLVSVAFDSPNVEIRKNKHFRNDLKMFPDFENVLVIDKGSKDLDVIFF